MKKFNDYLNEKYISEARVDVGTLDINFIRKAEVVSSFNIPANVYNDTKFKPEIQYLFMKHFFPGFDLHETIPTFETTAYNRVVAKLRAMDKNRLYQLFKYAPKGVGPGELLIYFIVDDASLGGGSSAGLDITTGGKGYEVKAASLGADGYFSGFKVGGTINLSGQIHAASEIKKKMGLPGRDTEINKSQIAEIKKSKYGSDWVYDVERPFIQKVANEYFGHHDTIFMINETPVKLRGDAFMKRVKPSDVELDSVTGGVIKPRIKN